MRNIEIKLGNKVFMEPQGNIAWGDGSLEPGTIVTIGRKYFYVQADNKSWIKEKFSLETMKNINEDCNSEYIIWKSEEDYNEDIQRREKLKAIQSLFRYGNDNRVSKKAIFGIYRLLQEDGIFKD